MWIFAIFQIIDYILDNDDDVLLACDTVEMRAVEQALNNSKIEYRYRKLIHNIYEHACMHASSFLTWEDVSINVNSKK